MSNQETAKKYSKIKIRLSIISSVIGFLLLMTFISTTLSREVESIAFGISPNEYLALLVFTGVLGLVNFLLTFPISFYSGYILEHRFNLSNQTIGKYLFEKSKALLLTLLLGVPLLLIFYFILLNYPQSWWVIFASVLTFFSLVLGRIAPTVIMPLFYKFKTLEDEEIKSSIKKMCEEAGVNVEGIYSFDMSKNTKKANAAFTGLGKSKRIILADTLLDKFSRDEILTVFAHELGHYKKRHIVKLITFSTILTFAGLYLVSQIYKFSLPLFGFSQSEPAQIAALPLLAILLSLYGLVTTPLSNFISRKFEWEADTYALKTTLDKESFISTMEKLADTNLSDKTPNKFIETFFHSHPSIQKRIEFARKYEL